MKQQKAPEKIELPSNLKIALVHDYINQFGGAERVFKTLTEEFPEADLYTLFYEEDETNQFLKSRIKGTSFLDKPFVRKQHRAFIPLMALAANMMNLGDKYDLIISDSAGFGKGIRYKNTPHIAYCHSPLRYAWEPDFYLGTLFSSPLIKAATPIFKYLQWWDKKAGKKPDLLVANSRHTADKLRQFYEREADVIHPPVDTDIFYYDKRVKKRDYFLALGRMIHYKRFDLTIQAFNRLKIPLKVVGTGPELERIKSMSFSPNIEFLSFISDEELRRVINGARALVFPQVEDFGLTAAESIACGTPVIAYEGGGALEIIEDGINGILFKDQTIPALTEGINRFEKTKFDPKKISETAQKFSKTNFIDSLRKSIKETLEGKNR